MREQLPPELDAEQARFVRGYSLSAASWPRAIKSKLLPMLSEAGVFIAQVMFMVAVVGLGALWLWAKLAEQPPPISDGSGIMWIFFIGAAIMLLSQLFRGRISRKLRWEYWEWPSFEIFMREEQRLQVLGALSLVMLIEVAVLALLYVL